MTTVLLQLDCDSELVDLALKRSLLPSIVNTPLYAPCVKHLLEHQSCDATQQVPHYLRVDNVAHQLAADGHEAEAAYLMAHARSVHPMLRTFNCAQAMLSKWLPRT